MNTPTPWTDAAYAKWQEGWDRTPFGPDLARKLERELYAVEARLASERGDHLRELATEREKVSALTAILESICEEWGRNHNAPFRAGNKMEKLASKALEKLEGEA
jgi:hypothetical protein